MVVGCAEQAQGRRTGDPVFTAWVRLAAPRCATSRPSSTRATAATTAVAVAADAVEAAVGRRRRRLPRRPGRRRWRRLPGRSRRPRRPPPARPSRGAERHHGRDGSFRSSVRIVHVDSEGQRKDGGDDERARRARGQAPGRGRAPRPPRLLTLQRPKRPRSLSNPCAARRDPVNVFAWRPQRSPGTPRPLGPPVSATGPRRLLDRARQAADRHGSRRQRRTDGHGRGLDRAKIELPRLDDARDRRGPVLAVRCPPRADPARADRGRGDRGPERRADRLAGAIDDRGDQ